MRTKTLVMAALFSAIVFMFTAYLFHIPIGHTGGYAHFGDAFIFIAATILPFPYGLLVGAIGASLADFASGVPVWIPYTIVIKPLMALCFTNKGDKILGGKRNLAAPVLAGIICLIGYYIAEGIIYGNFITPMASIGGGLIQFFGSIIFFYIFASIIDNRNLKGKML